MPVELRSEVFASTAHELLCHVAAVVGKEKNLEVGDRWRLHARSAMSPELLNAIVAFDIGHGLHGPWTNLLAMTYKQRWATVDDLLHGVEIEPENDLILQIAGVEEYPSARERLVDWVLRIAAGEKTAAPELLDAGSHAPQWAANVAKWLPRLAPRLRESLIEITTLWRRDLFGAEEARLTAILQRDAAAKQALASRLRPADLMEQATNGVAWVDQPGVEVIALLPTWVMRPWTLHNRAGNKAIISYPVADESLGQNGGAIAARAVKLARVLSDESRVRAIQLLAMEPLSLQELTEKLGLRKSTVHHHIAELKAAGLLRVPMGTKRYSLRPEALDRFGAVLAELARPGKARRKTA
ncbi:MAG: helix-turn-helix domain-containing protein [Candidatus Dormibacteraeota bacterium]|nr:helix-turn-helix domain-containing protein [Candidatus Dormibacteraeota bacterium]